MNLKDKLQWICLVAALGACSQKNESPTSPQGQQCQEDFVFDYNQVLLTPAHRSSLQAPQARLTEACARFQQRHPGVSCVETLEGQPTWFFSDDLEELCSTPQVQEDSSLVLEPEVVIEDEAPSLSPLPGSPEKTPKAAPEKPRTPIETPLTGAEFKDLDPAQISVLMQKGDRLNQMLADRETVLMRGEVDSLKNPQLLDQIQNQQIFCTLAPIQRKAWTKSLAQPQELAVKKITEEMESTGGFQRLSLVLDDERTGLILNCLRKTQKPLTPQDIQTAISPVMELVIRSR